MLQYDSCWKKICDGLYRAQMDFSLRYFSLIMYFVTLQTRTTVLLTSCVRFVIGCSKRRVWGQFISDSSDWLTRRPSFLTFYANYSDNSKAINQDVRHARAKVIVIIMQPVPLAQSAIYQQKIELVARQCSSLFLRPRHVLTLRKLSL